MVGSIRADVNLSVHVNRVKYALPQSLPLCCPYGLVQQGDENTKIIGECNQILHCKEHKY